MRENELKNSIQEALGMLTKEEKQTLLNVVVLCRNLEDGVTLRDLCSVMEAEQLVLNRQILYISQVGLLLSLDSVIICPDEVACYLSETDSAISDMEKNRLITRLGDFTNLSFSDDLMRAAPFFEMGYNLLSYCVNHPEGIDIKSFVRLVINLADHYDVYAQVNPSVYSVEQLEIMKAISFAKSKIKENTLIMAELLTSESYLFIAGFHYKKAMPLIQRAINIEGKHPNSSKEYSRTCLALSYYWNNWGDSASCLAWLWRAYQADKTLFPFISIIVSYQLSLVDEFEESDVWLGKVDINRYPQSSYVAFYYSLTKALNCKGASLESSITSLNNVDCLISQINVDAGVRATVSFCRYILFSQHSQQRAAIKQYQLYCQRNAKLNYSTGGAFVIYYASEVMRHAAAGNLIAAKQTVLHVLDLIDLTSDDWSLSVKLAVLHAYLSYDFACNIDLVNTRCDQGLEILENISKEGQNQDSLEILDQIFEGREIPNGVTGRDSLWFFEYTKLMFKVNNCTAITEECRSDVKAQIDGLSELFPEKKNLLAVVKTIIDMDDILTTHIELNNLIDNAPEHEKFNLCIQAARYLSSYIYDSNFFYQKAISTNFFKDMNNGEKVETMLECVPVLHACGQRGLAYNLYEDIAMMAKGCELFPQVYLTWAYCYFSAEYWQCAEKTYEIALSLIENEESGLDETLSTAYVYYALTLAALGKFEKGLIAIRRAKTFYPIGENIEETYNLLYYECYFLISLKKDSEAKRVLKEAANYATTDEEKKMLSDLESIMNKKTKIREMYFQPLMDSDDTF